MDIIIEASNHNLPESLSPLSMTVPKFGGSATSSASSSTSKDKPLMLPSKKQSRAKPSFPELWLAGSRKLVDLELPRPPSLYCFDQSAWIAHVVTSVHFDVDLGHVNVYLRNCIDDVCIDFGTQSVYGVSHTLGQALEEVLQNCEAVYEGIIATFSPDIVAAADLVLLTPDEEAGQRHDELPLSDLKSISKAVHSLTELQQMARSCMLDIWREFVLPTVKACLPDNYVTFALQCEIDSSQRVARDYSGKLARELLDAYPHPQSNLDEGLHRWCRLSQGRTPDTSINLSQAGIDVASFGMLDSSGHVAVEEDELTAEPSPPSSPCHQLLSLRASHRSSMLTSDSENTSSLPASEASSIAELSLQPSVDSLPLLPNYAFKPSLLHVYPEEARLRIDKYLQIIPVLESRILTLKTALAEKQEEELEQQEKQAEEAAHTYAQALARVKKSSYSPRHQSMLQNELKVYQNARSSLKLSLSPPRSKGDRQAHDRPAPPSRFSAGDSDAEAEMSPRGFLTVRSPTPSPVFTSRLLQQTLRKRQAAEEAHEPRRTRSKTRSDNKVKMKWYRDAQKGRWRLGRRSQSSGSTSSAGSTSTASTSPSSTTGENERVSSSCSSPQPPMLSSKKPFRLPRGSQSLARTDSQRDLFSTRTEGDSQDIHVS